jgi:hypothetical protein
MRPHLVLAPLFLTTAAGDPPHTRAAAIPKASAPMAEDDSLRAARSSAMTDVTNEMAAVVAHLPEPERRAARIRSHLIARQPPSPD